MEKELDPLRKIGQLANATIERKSAQLGKEPQVSVSVLVRQEIDAALRGFKTDLKDIIRQETRTILNLLASNLQHSQQRNEAYFKKLLEKQLRIEQPIGVIYRKGIEAERETLLRILLEIEGSREELAEIAETVESLRHWARLIQRSLPPDVSLREAVERLARHEMGVYGYIDVNLPLIPGIIHYKVEIGSEHKAELHALYDYLIAKWKAIKQRWGGE